MYVQIFKPSIPGFHLSKKFTESSGDLNLMLNIFCAQAAFNRCAIQTNYPHSFFRMNSRWMKRVQHLRDVKVCL